MNQTTTAAQGAVEIGMDRFAVADVIRGLAPRDFEKSMWSEASAAIWQDVYKPIISGRELYVKFYARSRRQISSHQLQGKPIMGNPRDYPDVIQSSESDRQLRRGVKMLTIDVAGQPFAYGQPGWWASLDDPQDSEGQLIDEDNVIWDAARREARAKARHTVLTPLVIRAIREACGLSQQDAARVFGGGAKAFEKYESGKVSPSSSMTRLLLLAARRPELFGKGAGAPMADQADAELIRETVRKSSVERIYQRIYDSGPDPAHKGA